MATLRREFLTVAARVGFLFACCCCCCCCCCADGAEDFSSLLLMLLLPNTLGFSSPDCDRKGFEVKKVRFRGRLAGVVMWMARGRFPRGVKGKVVVAAVVEVVVVVVAWRRRVAQAVMRWEQAHMVLIGALFFSGDLLNFVAFDDQRGIFFLVSTRKRIGRECLLPDGKMWNMPRSEWWGSS